MAAISTRLTRPGDEVAVADLHTTAWRVAYRGVIPDGVLDDDRLADARRTDWHRTIVDGHRFIDDVDQEIWVGELDGRVVGFGHVGDSDPATGRRDCGEIFGFYLHPDAWGSGVADALMARCLTHLQKRFERAILWTLRDTPRSRRFYERHGWFCGSGDEVVIDWWDGPVVDGQRMLPEPVAEVQYRHRLGR